MPWTIRAPQCSQDFGGLSHPGTLALLRVIVLLPRTLLSFVQFTDWESQLTDSHDLPVGQLERGHSIAKGLPSQTQMVPGALPNSR